MRKIKTFLEREKILEGMDKVSENLMTFKRRMDSDLIVYRNGKILHVKPE